MVYDPSTATTMPIVGNITIGSSSNADKISIAGINK
jgi:hypothetical protein